MSSTVRKARLLVIATIALCTCALAAAAGTSRDNAPPKRTRVNSILQKQYRPAHAPAAKGHAPGKPGAKRKSDQQLRAEVRAIERDGTGYISPARQRVLDQQASKRGAPSGH